MTGTTELSTMKLISKQWKILQRKNPKQGASTWQILDQEAGHHKRKVKRGGMAYLAKDREGKEVFKEVA